MAMYSCYHGNDEVKCFVRSDQEAGFTGQRMRGVVRENQPKLLTRLLQICFERFKNVIQAHGVLLSHLQRTRNVYKRSELDPPP